MSARDPSTPQLPSVGRCKGCDRAPRRLDDGVCADCLDNPRLGRRWAEMAHRCRTDGGFRRAVFSQIRSPRGRRLFLIFFGAPHCAAPEDA